MNPSYYDDLRVYILLSTLLSVIVVAGLILFLTLSRFWGWPRPGADPRFKGREPLTLDQFYQRFYADEGFPRDTVQEVLVSFAEAARLPHAFLHPQDSFTALRVPESEQTERLARETDNLIQQLERQFGLRIFAGPLTTLDDYIRVYGLAHRLVSRSGSAGS